MPKLPFHAYGVRVVFLAGFALAELLLLTGTWQLAFLAGFVAGILSARGRDAIALGALSVAAAWSAYLVYVFVAGAGVQLADLVGEILGMGPGAWWFLTLLTIVLGILVGATGGATGYTASRLFLWQPAPADAESPKG